MQRAIGIAAVLIGIVPLPGQARAGVATTIAFDPPAKDRVEPIDYLSGKVSPISAKVWVVVKPAGVDQCWVQSPVIVEADGTFRAEIRFGENTTAHSGARYEVRALANPKKRVRVGKTACWPSAYATSKAVYLTRV